jgi:predicted DNA-binding helix-hairpin-helix protein
MTLDARDKLKVLSQDARYDLACACCSHSADHRQRSEEGLWLYPVTLPNGGKSVLLKTLMANACANDFLYCPTRNDRDVPHCTLSPDDTARIFMDLVRRKKAFGIFLSSSVIGTPDRTMDRLCAAARILRGTYGYPGYIHLKIIPGASDASIEDAVSLASAVSINIEVPTEKALARLSKKKEMQRDILRPMNTVRRLTSRGSPRAKVKQTTQFVVGASEEKDAEIVKSTHALYRRMKLNRVYYSAYQRGTGDPSIPGEANPPKDPHDLLTREHRLYQVDFLFRDYGWDLGDIAFETDANLSLTVDPKERWAELHPEFFPVRLLTASRRNLLRVPGLGPLTAKRILKARKRGCFRNLGRVGVKGKRLEKLTQYVVFS